MSSQDLIWTTQYWEEIRVKDMSYNHARNTLAMLKRNQANAMKLDSWEYLLVRKAWIAAFEVKVAADPRRFGWLRWKLANLKYDLFSS